MGNDLLRYIKWWRTEWHSCFALQVVGILHEFVIKLVFDVTSVELLIKLLNLYFVHETVKKFIGSFEKTY